MMQKDLREAPVKTLISFFGFMFLLCFCATVSAQSLECAKYSSFNKERRQKDVEMRQSRVGLYRKQIDARQKIISIDERSIALLRLIDASPKPQDTSTIWEELDKLSLERDKLSRESDAISKQLAELSFARSKDRLESKIELVRLSYECAASSSLSADLKKVFQGIEGEGRARAEKLLAERNDLIVELKKDYDAFVASIKSGVEDFYREKNSAKSSADAEESFSIKADVSYDKVYEESDKVREKIDEIGRSISKQLEELTAILKKK